MSAGLLAARRDHVLVRIEAGPQPAVAEFDFAAIFRQIAAASGGQLVDGVGIAHRLRRRGDDAAKQ